MKTLKFCIVLVLAITLAACCACRRNKSVLPLQGIEWHLTQLDGKAVSSDNYRVTFADEGRLSGIGECNRFTGTYTFVAGQSAGSGTIDVTDNLASTRMMCLGENRENDYFAMLSAIDSYSIDGQRLMLIRNGDVVAIFEPAPAKPEN